MIVHASPLNPAEFFGACGFFELAASQRAELVAHWGDEGLEIVDYSEADANALIQGLADATLTPDSAWAGDESTRPFSLSNADHGLDISMDWWERRDGSGNTPWKCFGGRQKSTDSASLLHACRSLIDKYPSLASECLRAAIPLSGRLGFDPRSAWLSLDTGFSPNDLGKKYSVIPSFPFAELLTAVVAQRWPIRFQRGQGQFFTWDRPLPLPVARVVAASDGSPYSFGRIKRGQGISAFTFSRPGAAF